MASQPKPKKKIERFQVSSGDRVIDEESGTTKQGVADYYQAILDRLYPHLENRPVSVIRCPDGVDGECFFQRHSKNQIPGTKEVPVEDEEYLALSGPEGVLGVVQFGGIEFHPWGCQAGAITQPDRLIFDLDPGPSVKWKKVQEAALLLKEMLEGVGLNTFLKLSGGKGLHVVIPILPELDWDQAKAFTKTLAESLAKEHPKDYVSKMTKSIRGGKIFVDYLRNDQTSTAVAPYSLRSRKGMPIAWPIEWDWLEDFESAADITVANYEDWLEKPDPWADMPKKAVSLKKILRI